MNTSPDAGYGPVHFGPGTLGCHEALHTSWVIFELFEREVCSHPSVQLDPAWVELADKAQAALHDLYAAIADKHLSVP